MRSVHTAATPEDIGEPLYAYESEQEHCEWTAEEVIADHVAMLLDVVVIGHHNSPTEETFVECKMCGEWDSHKDRCPVPALEQWLNPT